MILLIDFGNSRAKFCFANDIALSNVEAVDYHDWQDNYFEQHFTAACKVIVSSVTHQDVTERLRLWCQQSNRHFVEVHSEKSRFGVKNCYELPEKLGVDRWLALVGATKKYLGQNVLIIDSGTATTCDLLLNNGKHCGGWILPGVKSLSESVIRKTVKVDAQQQHVADLRFGENTTACVNNASWAATVGLVNCAITQATELCTLDKVLLLGGNAEQLQKLCDFPLDIDQSLIFTGLLQYSR